MSLNLKWTGSAIFITGSNPTPFGTYDSDNDFILDAPKTAVWCAKRLGYPIVDVELVQDQFFACFEEATSEYSAQVNQFQIRNNLEILKGNPKDKNYSQTLVDGAGLQTVVRISQAYGTLVGVGGTTNIKKAYVQLTSGVQVYDIMNEAIDAPTSQSFATLYGTGSGLIDVTRVYFEAVPAIARFFDPYSVGAQGTLNLMSELGFGQYSPAAQFQLMPIYEDLLRMQAIELNDTIRKSAFTFNIVNNKLEIFPVPSALSPIRKIYFEYMVKDEFQNNATVVKNDVISDYSNIRYDFIQYSDINDVGRQWIRKYTLALAKELLGAIREKYSSIPIPDAEISLDGAALRAEAQTEKDELIKQLRENLEELSRKTQFENKKTESDFHQDMLRKIPLKLYIG